MRRSSPRARAAARLPLRTVKVRSDGLENPDVPIDEVDDEVIGAIGSRWNSAGVKLNRAKALTYSPWWRGINLLSRAVAKLPLHIYKFEDETQENKVRDREHPAYRLLRRKPNPYMTAAVWKQLLMHHAITEGNHYSYIFRNGSAAPLELLPLVPTQTWPVIENGRLLYVTTVNNKLRKLLPENVFHLKALSNDGILGHSAYDKARESLGLGIATRTFNAHFFKQGTRTSGILMYPQHLKEDAVKRMLREWKRTQTGLDNSHKVAVLQEGAKYIQTSTNPSDAQLTDTRQFEYREIANFLGLPSHKLNDKEGQAYNSLEQENQQYLDESIDPWLVMIEEEAWDKLLTEQQKTDESHFIEFERRAMLRVDMRTRGEFYSKALQHRWMVPDEVRARENLNALPNGEGKKLAPPPNQSLRPNKAEEKMRRMARRFASDAIGRMAKRVGTHLRKAGKSPEALRHWLEHELPTHRDVVADAFRPVGSRTASRRMAAMFLRAVRRAAEQQLAAAPADLPAAIDATLRRFEDELPQALIRRFGILERKETRAHRTPLSASRRRPHSTRNAR